VSRWIVTEDLAQQYNNTSWRNN